MSSAEKKLAARVDRGRRRKNKEKRSSGYSPLLLTSPATPATHAAPVMRPPPATRPELPSPPPPTPLLHGSSQRVCNQGQSHVEASEGN